MYRLTCGIVLLLLSLCIVPSDAATYVNRFPDGQGGYYWADLTIKAGQSQTWTAAGNPYVVERQIVVEQGGSLTIEPGVTVLFYPWEDWAGWVRTGMCVNGTLHAVGTAGAPITFTSGQDPPGPGNWRGIYLGPGADASVLQYCTITYSGFWNGIGCGGGGIATSLCIDGCSPSVTNCTINRSHSTGITLRASQATVQDNHFEDIGVDATAPAYPISILTAETFPVLSGNSVSGYGLRAVSASGGTSTISGRWRLPGAGLAYHLRGTFIFQAGTAFTLDPGVTVRFADFMTLMHIFGTLDAQGTAGLPITFTGMKDEPAPGDWVGIYLSPASGGSILNHCVVKNGGSANTNVYGLGVFHGATRYGALWVDACSPAITNCLFLDNALGDIGLYASNATIQNNTFRNVSRTSHNILFETPDCFPVMSGNLAEGTGVLGVGVLGGTSNASGRWMLGGTNFRYDILGDVTFASGTTLTLDPGMTIEFGWVYGLYIKGALKAPGTVAAPITFTSQRTDPAYPDNPPAAGNWRGVYLGPDSSASVLSHCNFAYGGGSAGVYHNLSLDGLLVIDSSSPSVTDCSFAQSTSHGIVIYGGHPVIKNNTINEINTYYGEAYAIYYAIPDTFPDIAGNSGTTTKGTIGVGIAGGPMAQSGKWPVAGANFAYYPTSTITVAPAATLTIDPGVTVKPYGQSGLVVNGTLTAIGTTAAPITFTSRYTPPEWGQWSGIYLGPTAGASVLDHCILSYGGFGMGTFNGVNFAGMVAVDASSPTITNCVLSQSYSHGIHVNGGHAAIKYNTINEINGYYGDGYSIFYNTPNTVPDISGNSGTTTKGTTGVGIAGGTMTTSGKWPVAGTNFPYYFAGDITVDAAATLTIDPGVTVKPSWLTGLYVNGTLSARGTPAAPITFTSRYTPVSSGQWRGIYLAPTAGASALTHCTVSYSGQGMGDSPHGYRDAALFVDAIAPTLDCITVSYSSTNGIILYGGSGALRNSVVTRSGIDGVRLRGGSTVTLANLTVDSNGYTGVHTFDSSPTVVNTIVSHSGDWGVRAEGTGAPAVRYSNVGANAPGDYTGMTDPTPANGTMKADPLFVDRGYGDFRLTSTSLCINTGDNAAVPTGATDRTGAPRIYGSAVDMGAYETSSALIPGYLRSEVITALKITGGLLTSDTETVQRLNLEMGVPAATRIDILDVLRLIRKVNRTDVNP